jgi:hypothetical protein
MVHIQTQVLVLSAVGTAFAFQITGDETFL